MDHTVLTDPELMQHIQQQDQLALAALYERYGSVIYSLALHVLRDSVLAEEVTQDTFMKLWRQPHQWDAERGPLKNWLLTIARYTAIDRLRVEVRHTNRAVPLVDEIQAHDDDLQGTGADIDRHLLRRLINELPPEQGSLILMGFYQGLTHRQLAEKLGLPLGTVKSRVRLGLQKLKALWTAAVETHE